MLSLGIDSGSTATKGVLFDGAQVIACAARPTSLHPDAALRALCAELHGGEADVITTTGYGRHLLPEARYKITEITCHGAGAAFLAPGCDTVIDIGGQDCKVIALDRDGCVTDFLMNDKCAAGTGRFMQMTTGRVGSDISQLDAFVDGCTPVAINSMCTVFAESEIVGLLARQTAPGDIVLGCVHSICRRTAVFAQRISAGRTIFFSGGLAQSDVMRAVLGEYLSPAALITHPLAPFAGAVGAAVLGWQKYQRRRDTNGTEKRPARNF